MTAPDHHPAPADERSAKLVRAAIWVAIGALIAAAVVSVVWVLIGSQNDIIGRAFLTIVLLAAFAGVAILDSHLAPRRPVWFALASMLAWVLSLLIGAFLVWMPERAFSGFVGFTRLMSFLLIVLVLQLALLHIRLYTKAIERHPTPFTRVVGYITIGLVVLLAVMLVLPLMLSEWVEFYSLYWRLMVAVAILAAVGTALVPLVSVLFAPKRPRPAPAAAPRAWPTYVDGVTPLPVLPDGTPDWNAYYTGHPTYPAHTAAVSAMADAAYAHMPSQGQPVVTPSEPQPPAPREPQPAAPPTDPAGSAPDDHVQPAPSAAQAPPPAAPAAAPAAGYEGFPPPPPLPPRV